MTAPFRPLAPSAQSGPVRPAPVLSSAQTLQGFPTDEVQRPQLASRLHFVAPTPTLANLNLTTDQSVFLET